MIFHFRSWQNREMMGNIFKNIRKSVFWDLKFFCNCCPGNNQNNSQMWTDRERLLNKVKLFKTILESHGLLFCSGSMEISRIQLYSARNELESFIFLTEAKLLFYSWNVEKTVHPNFREKFVFHWQNMDFWTATIFKILQENTI